MTNTPPEGCTQRGLCEGCRHSRVVASAKGRTYLLCERSFSDPEFSKYPAIPVTQCAGFEQKVGPLGQGERS